jgi:hypothetical protein
MTRILKALRSVFTAPPVVDAAELVNGPHSGFFVAAYSLPDINGFIAYAKVFRERPSDPWEGFAIAKYTAYSGCSNTALRLAQSRALGAISGWHH